MSNEAINWAVEIEHLTRGGKLIVLLLANRANGKNQCWPGIRNLMRQACMSNRGVHDCIAQLESSGLIIVERRGGTGAGSQTNRYELLLEGYPQTQRQSEPTSLCPNRQSEPTSRSKVNLLHRQCEVGSTESKEKLKTKPKERGAPSLTSLDEFSISTETANFALNKLGYENNCYEREVEKWRKHRSNKQATDRSAIEWDGDLRSWLRRGVDFGYHQNSRNYDTKPTSDTLESLAKKLNISRMKGESDEAIEARVRDADTLHRYPHLAAHVGENGKRYGAVP